MLTFFRRRYRTAGAIIYRNRFHTDLFEGRGQAGLRSLIRLVSHNGRTGAQITLQVSHSYLERDIFLDLLETLIKINRIDKECHRVLLLFRILGECHRYRTYSTKQQHN